MKTNTPISVILLVHQEADVIEATIDDIYEKIISKIPDSEFIICEDGSTDGTKEILSRIKNQYNLLLHMGNERKGYTKAMREAFSLASKPIIFFSDSDGQHDPEDFWKMYHLLDTYDMVIGWKKERKDGLFRLILTKIYNKLIGLYFGVQFHDIDCGFRVIKKDAVDYLMKSEWELQHCISSELTVKAQKGGFKVGEVPVRHKAREFGESRGLPVSKLPKIILHILSSFPKIRRDINGNI